MYYLLISTQQEKLTPSSSFNQRFLKFFKKKELRLVGAADSLDVITPEFPADRRGTSIQCIGDLSDPAFLSTKAQYPFIAYCCIWIVNPRPKKDCPRPWDGGSPSCGGGGGMGAQRFLNMASENRSRRPRRRSASRASEGRSDFRCASSTSKNRFCAR